jgi:hypothetical protein
MVTIDLEQAGHGLLFEPLARVARIGAGAGSELVRRGGAVIRECAVPAEAVAEVDAGDVERRDGSTEDALRERVGGGGHRSSMRGGCAAARAYGGCPPRQHQSSRPSRGRRVDMSASGSHIRG